MLELVVGNRCEILAARLAERLRRAPLPVLAAETIAVPSTALARWLEFRLADLLGIAAHIDWAFPAELAWRLIARVLPEVVAESPFAAQRMKWRLLRLCMESEAPELAAYFAHEDGRKGYELASRLASVYERYLVERPEWPIAWAQGRRLGLGEDEAWQATLWQRLLKELPVDGLVHPAERFFARLAIDEAARSRMPSRLTFFCAEDMPRMYWDFFQRLADFCPITIYALSPTREYWADLVDEKRRDRLAGTHPDAAYLFEMGHPLLASLGRGRQHLGERLAELAGEDCYEAAGAETLLSRLQNDLLALTTSTGIAYDGTIECHACHGAQREAEVLADRLLACFLRYPDLHPSQILILTPDIETYGPLVRAVLEEAPEARRIPCRVADLPLAELPLLQALTRLVETLSGDFAAENVMGLLDEAAIRRAFSLAEEEVACLRGWVAEAGVRWGIDASFRARRGLPAEEAHSWRFGIRRLLYSLAMPDDAPPYEGIVVVPGVFGSRAERLGRFLDFADALFAAADDWPEKAPPLFWCARLQRLAERFLAAGEDEIDDWLRLRRALRELAATLEEARVEAPVRIDVVLSELSARLAERASMRAFVSGCATIAQLAVGRPIPARIVCLVGMNDGAWPGPHVPEGFDLVSRHRRAGDRDRRQEERYAFLEALLSARDALIITFTGADPRGHAEFPPAAPVAELLATLAKMTGSTVSEMILRHPLQPFSADYFVAPGHLFTFATECQPPERKAEEPPFFATPIDLATEEREVGSEGLKEALAQPARFFLRDCCGIRLESQDACLEDEEPFAATGLTGYHLQKTLLAGFLAGESRQAMYARVWGEGLLPHGQAGKVIFERALGEISAVFEEARRLWGAAKWERRHFAFDLMGVRLIGTLAEVGPAGLIQIKAGRLSARDRLRCWIDHLVWQLVATREEARESLIFSREGVWRLKPVEEAARLLGDLLTIHRAAAKSPLPFHPETAWAFVSGSKNWRQSFFGSDFKMGELDRDPYLALAWRGREEEAVGEAFQALARRIWEPMREAGR